MQKQIISLTGKAVESLFALDIKLSNAYHGDNSEHDQCITIVRNRIQLAMDCLNLEDLLRFLKGGVVVQQIPELELKVICKNGCGNLDGKLEGIYPDMNPQMEGIERLLLALALAGVPIASKPCKEALTTVVNAIDSQYGD